MSSCRFQQAKVFSTYLANEKKIRTSITQFNALHFSICQLGRSAAALSLPQAVGVQYRRDSDKDTKESVKDYAPAASQQIILPGAGRSMGFAHYLWKGTCEGLEIFARCRNNSQNPFRDESKPLSSVNQRWMKEGGG